MNPEQLLTALIGAFFGALGWFVVGMVMARAASTRQARSAGRAVYFELAVNAVNVTLAADHNVFQPLSRSAWDRLLPELADRLPADDLLTIARAYMGHAGYEQLRDDPAIPAQARRAVLTGLRDVHSRAIRVVRRAAFSAAEITRMEAAGDPVAAVASADAGAGDRPSREATRAHG